MKIAVYGMRADEEHCMKEVAKELNIEVDLHKDKLDIETATMALGADGVSTLGPCNIDNDVVRVLHENGVKYILPRCTGYDNINKEAVKKYGLRVANVSRYSKGAISEFTVMLALEIVRNHKEESRMIENRNFGMPRRIATELGEMTVGVIGTGFIGSTTAKIISAIGSKILANDPFPKDELQGIVTYTNRETIYAESDLILFHCPLTEENKHMVNENSISKMKDGVFLINTARGLLFNYKDVLNGLKTGKIAGLAADVYENEAQYIRKDCKNVILDPILEELLKMDNVIITPHIAGITDVAARNMIDTSFRNFIDFYQSGRCKNEIFID